MGVYGMLPVRRDSNKERGSAAVGVLLLVGGVAFSWWLFMTIMDYIRDNHRAKVQERVERFESYKKKAPKPVARDLRGYQVRY